MRGELAAALHRVNSRLPEARERVACVHWDFAKHMTRGGGGGGGGGVKRGDGVSGGSRNPSNPPLEPPSPPPPSPSPAPATTPGLLELTRVAAGALELTGVFVVAPVAGLRSAEKRRATDGRGGPVSRARPRGAARCELFTGMDVVGDDARAAPLGGGDPDAPAPGAGRSANPWKHAVGVITPNDSSAPNVPRASSVGVARQRGVLRSHCIDCLDRTNVAQFAFGLASLAAQLEALGIGDGAPVAPDGTLAGVLMRAYRAMGNALALQYGGSEAHAKVREFRRDERAARDVGEEEEGERVAPASFSGSATRRRDSARPPRVPPRDSSRPRGDSIPTPSPTRTSRRASTSSWDSATDRVAANANTTRTTNRRPVRRIATSTRRRSSR